jgi:hypothetical protein
MVALLVFGVVLLAVAGGGLAGLVAALGIAAARRPPAARTAHPPGPAAPRAPAAAPVDAEACTEACTELWTLSPPHRADGPGLGRRGRVIETHRQAGW